MSLKLLGHLGIEHFPLAILTGKVLRLRRIWLYSAEHIIRLAQTNKIIVMSTIKNLSKMSIGFRV